MFNIDCRGLFSLSCSFYLATLEIQVTELLFFLILKIILPVFVVFSFFQPAPWSSCPRSPRLPGCRTHRRFKFSFFFILEEIIKGINAQSARHVGLEVVTTPHAMASPTEVSGGSGVILQQMEQN